MTENFIVAVEAVFPMVVLMAAGVLVRRSGIVGQEENRHFNRMIFVVFFPMMMFSNLYGIELKNEMEWDFLIFGIAAVTAVYLISLPVVMKIEKNPKSRGAMIQAIYRSNFVIMGMPVAANIYGHGNLAVTAMMVSVIVPYYNVLAVVTLEVFRGGRIRPLNIVKQILKNPLIIGGIAGIAASLTGLVLPGPVEKLVEQMSVVATPMALVILGISFDFSSIRKCSRNLVVAVTGRLIAVPAVMLAAGALMGYRDVEFVTLIAMAASPTAVSSFTMAESMDSDSTLAGNCVIISSVLSCFTIFMWVFISKNLGMF